MYVESAKQLRTSVAKKHYGDRMQQATKMPVATKLSALGASRPPSPNEEITQLIDRCTTTPIRRFACVFK
jgi:hypothetical protein